MLLCRRFASSQKIHTLGVSVRIRDRAHTDRMPQSYYTATMNDPEPFSRLEGHETADVCVVGGGFTGVATALELAKRGISVILLEQNQIGWGASGRNGGQILGGYGPEMSEYNKYIDIFGEAKAQTVWDMGIECVEIIKDTVEEYQIECDLTWGYFDAAMKQSELDALKHAKIMMEARGYEAEQRFVGKDQAKSIVGSDRYIGGLVNMGWGHCNPLNLVRAEARAAENLGVHVCEDARVQSITYNDAGAILDTGHGKVDAKTVVLAGNAYLGHLVPKLAARMLPVGSYIIATEPLDSELADEIMPENYAVCDQRRVLDYFRMSPDKRLLYGGLATYSGVHPYDIKKAIRPNLLKTFPQLEDVKIDYAWGGYIGVGMNRLPQLGMINDKAYFAQAYAGHGVAASHMSARLIAEAIIGDRSRYDIIAGVKHSAFPGGRLFRQPILAAGMAYAHLLDCVKD